MQKSAGSSLRMLLIAAVTLVFLLAAWLIFYQLGTTHIRIFDEARYANNAIDMLQGKDPVVIRFMGEPDVYNTKPPLLTWMQSLTMSVAGINEWSVRFPSALAALLTAACLLWFSLRVLKSWFAACVSMLVLVSAKGFMLDHAARTGDPDALLTFWLTLYAISFFALLINRPERTRNYFLLIAIGITGAVLTKGIAGLFFTPYLFLISLLPKNRFIWRHKQLYFAAGISAVIVLGYYFLREAMAPGYLRIVYDAELSRIGKSVMSWHEHPFGFYWQNMRESRFSYFIYVLPFTLLTPLFIWKNKTILNAFFWILFTATGYFFFISYPAVKLEWYDVPLYPLFALLIGIFAGSVYQFVSEKIKSPVLPVLLFLLILIPAFYKPFSEMIQLKNTVEENLYDKEADGAFLRYLHAKHPEIHDLGILKTEEHIEHFDQIRFYARAFEIEDGLHTSITEYFQQVKLAPGAYVMTTQQQHKDSLNANYQLKVLDEWKSGSFYRVEAVK